MENVPCMHCIYSGTCVLYTPFPLLVYIAICCKMFELEKGGLLSRGMLFEDTAENI